MTPGLRDAIHTNAWLLTTALVLVAATIAVERATRGLVDVTLVRAFAEQLADDDVFGDDDGFDEEFDPTNHRANHPSCEVCRGIEARADHVWGALVAQLEGGDR